MRTLLRRAVESVRRSPFVRCVHAAGLALFVVGCVQAEFQRTTHVERGRYLDPATVDRIVIGETTRGDLFRWLGPPYSMVRDTAELTRSESVGFYRYAERRPLQTIQDSEYALLYRFDRTDAHLTIHVLGAGPAWHERQQAEATFTGDELLVLLDRKTNVVVDVAAHTQDRQP